MSYGKYWEKYPIQEKEIWSDGSSFISVNDITKGIPEYMNNCEMIYSDTPWSLSNINMFNKKAGREKMNGFSEFHIPLFEHIKKINPKYLYLEIGLRNKDLFVKKCSELYDNIQTWDIVYYKKHPCVLIRASNIEYKGEDLTGLDDEDTPLKAIENDKPKSVGDFCTGRGLTGIAAHKYGIPFYGTELNRRKLAVFIHRANKINVNYEKALHT